MTTSDGEAHRFGGDVFGPILGEFFVRLWATCSTVARQTDAVVLFSARGGLRLQLGYEEFLRTTGLTQELPHAPLMISRLAAARLPLTKRAGESLSRVAPRTAAALRQEFGRSSLTSAVTALSGCSTHPHVLDSELAELFTPDRLSEYLDRHDEGAATRRIGEQASLFEQHLRQRVDGRPSAIVVDTGLYGTTQVFLEEGVTDLRIASFLLAKTVRSNAKPSPAVGLSVDSANYNPLQRRTCVLRYWHLMEAMLEPDVPSVRSFEQIEGVVVSDLEVQGWADRLEPPDDEDSFFGGAMSYLRSLDHDGVQKVAKDAPSAWRTLHRSIVWPRKQDWALLQPSARGHDFGRAGGVSPREDEGLLAAVSGRSLWREGEIARSGSLARVPALAMIECAHVARAAAKILRRG